MQAKQKNIKKNKKKDCSTCVNHGICLAEQNIEPYSCPIPDDPKQDNFKIFTNK